MGAKLLPIILLHTLSAQVIMHTLSAGAAPCWGRPASHFAERSSSTWRCFFVVGVWKKKKKACPGAMHIIARRAAAGFGSPVLSSLCTSRLTGSRRLFTMAELSSEQVVFNKPKVRYRFNRKRWWIIASGTFTGFLRTLFVRKNKKIKTPRVPVARRSALDEHVNKEIKNI